MFWHTIADGIFTIILIVLGVVVCALVASFADYGEGED